MGYKHIQVKPVSTFIGAEISGVNLSQFLSEEEVQEIRKHC
ncbi:hypothetical protein [Trichocoleus sp. FACHB-46]|nr:hypothetical protein [Trichocoleus sp. FACHB-46]